MNQNSPNGEADFLPEEALSKAACCLKIMAHPIRLRIAEIIMKGSYAVHEIAELCHLQQNQVCEHLRLMQGAGLLTSERRGRAVYYSIVSPQLLGLMACIREHCDAAGTTAERSGTDG